jgi:hypothetical protein
VQQIGNRVDREFFCRYLLVLTFHHVALL